MKPCSQTARRHNMYEEGAMAARILNLDTANRLSASRSDRFTPGKVPPIAIGYVAGEETEMTWNLQAIFENTNHPLAA